MAKQCDRIDELTVTRIFCEARRLRLKIATGVGYSDPKTGKCDPLGLLAIQAMPGLSGQRFGLTRVLEATRLPVPFLRGMADGFDGVKVGEAAEKLEIGLYAKGFGLGKDCRVRANAEEKRWATAKD